MAIPLSTTGSLSPTFVPARPVRLAVKLPSAFALFARFPSALREPLGASVTLSEATPQSNCPPETVRKLVTLLVRIPIKQGWYPTSGSMNTGVLTSQLPTILYISYRNPISGYSKAPWGLSVQSRVTCIFTGTSISPGPSLRQCQIVTPFVRVGTYPTRNFATLGPL